MLKSFNLLKDQYKIHKGPSQRSCMKLHKIGIFNNQHHYHSFESWQEKLMSEHYVIEANISSEEYKSQGEIESQKSKALVTWKLFFWNLINMKGFLSKAPFIHKEESFLKRYSL